jgi:hypothetical protein
MYVWMQVSSQRTPTPAILAKHGLVSRSRVEC